MNIHHNFTRSKKTSVFKSFNQKHPLNPFQTQFCFPLPLSKSNSSKDPQIKLQIHRSTSKVPSISSIYNSPTHHSLLSPTTPQSLSKTIKKKLEPNSVALTKLNKNPYSEKLKKSKTSAKESLLTSPKASIQSRIKDLGVEYAKNGLTQETFTQYEELFLSIIEQDTGFGDVLNEIKQKYDEKLLISSELTKETFKVQSENLKLNQEIQQKSQDCQTLQKKVQILCTENADLGRLVEKLNSDIRALQDQLEKIATVSLEEISQDELSWKALVVGNFEYSSMCSDLKKRVEELEQKQTVYLETLCKLQQAGFKLENLFVEDSESEKQDNSIEFEYLLSFREKVKNRNEGVPRLNLNQAPMPSYCSELDSGGKELIEVGNLNS